MYVFICILYVYVLCMFICMYVCMHICMYACCMCMLYICTCICMCACCMFYVCTCVCMYVNVCRPIMAIYTTPLKCHICVNKQKLIDLLIGGLND